MSRAALLKTNPVESPASASIRPVPSVPPDQPVIGRHPGEQPTLEETEKAAVAGALARFGGNISRTAAALGISRPTLYRKMIRYGLMSRPCDQSS